MIDRDDLAMTSVRGQGKVEETQEGHGEPNGATKVKTD